MIHQSHLLYFIYILLYSKGSKYILLDDQEREQMSKTITLRLTDQIHKKLRTLAERDHRTLSNFIETATLRYVEHGQFVDEFEMNEVLQNEDLNKSLKRAHRDMKTAKGRFVE